MTTRRSRTERLYSADLAHIHDAGFGDFAKRAGPELVRILRAHRIRNGLIVEAGCGSGILAAHLVDAGYEVFAFDQSTAMIRLARARAAAARFRVASFTRMILPACRAVVAIGEIITYLSSGVGGVFERVHAALEPGGLFIFDFMESGERRIYPASIIEGDGWSLVARADLSASGRVLTRRLIAKRMIRKTWRRTRETHRVRIYSKEEIGRALAAAGFSACMRRFYGRCRLMPGDVAVIARKS